MVWLYRNPQGIIGHQGAIPVKVKIGSAERLTGWFVETAVLESVRGRTIGPMVIAKARQDLPFNLSLGQTPEMRAIQFKLGWRQVCPLGTYVFVLNARRVLEAKIRSGSWRHGAARALAAVQHARYLYGQRRLRWTPAVREIARFDATHTRLWNEVKDQYPCAVVRDASYLNWKYVEQPGQDFIRLEIKRHSKVVAVVVLTILEPSEGRTSRQGVIVDVVLPPSDRDVTWAALDMARQTLQRRGADVMAFDLASVALSRRVRSFGFFASAPLRVLLVSSEGLSPEIEALVCSPDNWLLTGGDSDIDRPW